MQGRKTLTMGPCKGRKGEERRINEWTTEKRGRCCCVFFQDINLKFHYDYLKKKSSFKMLMLIKFQNVSNLLFQVMNLLVCDCFCLFVCLL